MGKNGTREAVEVVFTPWPLDATGNDLLRDYYETALRRIGTRCQHFVVPYSCRDEHSGKRIDGYYGAYRWCEQCIAADALEYGREPRPPCPACLGEGYVPSPDPGNPEEDDVDVSLIPCEACGAMGEASR